MGGSRIITTDKKSNSRLIQLKTDAAFKSGNPASVFSVLHAPHDSLDGFVPGTHPAPAFLGASWRAWRGRCGCLRGTFCGVDKTFIEVSTVHACVLGGAG